MEQKFTPLFVSAGAAVAIAFVDNCFQWCFAPAGVRFDDGKLFSTKDEAYQSLVNWDKQHGYGIESLLSW